jgi:hypothetical protein
MSAVLKATLLRAPGAAGGRVVVIERVTVLEVPPLPERGGRPRRYYKLSIPKAAQRA